jgi:hypothetical protein
MEAEDIELKILRYLDDGFEDTDYIDDVVNAQPFSDLAALICNLLRSSEYDRFSMTGLFLRDAILKLNRDCQHFCAAYPNSEIVNTLEDLVFSPNHFIQSEAIYTLGKTCSYSSKDVLSTAFDRFRDSDPLLLDRLINEMVWLGVENVEHCLEQMVTSSSYLTRWAAVEHIYQSQDRLPNWAEILRRDNCEFIRLEAEYECQCILKSIQTSILSKVQQRQRAREIKKIEPKISWQQVSLKFSSYLFHNGFDRYTVAEMETYLDREIFTC